MGKLCGGWRLEVAPSLTVGARYKGIGEKGGLEDGRDFKDGKDER